MDESAYELYKMTKQLIARTKGCVNHDHTGETLYKCWEKAIEYLDKSNKGYAEKYEKEIENAAV
jgi:arabinogalactan endo-1,4-beta-galactosidase